MVRTLPGCSGRTPSRRGSPRRGSQRTGCLGRTQPRRGSPRRGSSRRGCRESWPERALRRTRPRWERRLRRRGQSRTASRKELRRVCRRASRRGPQWESSRTAAEYLPACGGGGGDRSPETGSTGRSQNSGSTGSYDRSSCPSRDRSHHLDSRGCHHRGSTRGTCRCRACRRTRLPFPWSLRSSCLPGTGPSPCPSRL